MLKTAANCVLASQNILNVPQEGTPPVFCSAAALLDGRFEHPDETY
jgi:hypothetical protein